MKIAERCSKSFGRQKKHYVLPDGSRFGKKMSRHKSGNANADQKRSIPEAQSARQSGVNDCRIRSLEK